MAKNLETPAEEMMNRHELTAFARIVVPDDEQQAKTSWATEIGKNSGETSQPSMRALSAVTY
jgi:hypothetical protein